MEPIKYVSCLNETYQAEGFPPYRWSEFDSSPWQPFEKPLNQTRLALISSGGIFKEDQAPFDPWAVNDLSFREIDVDVDFKKLNLHHNYFDHRDALQDFNVVYPVDRLKELAEAGFIGSLAPTVISLGMGRLYKRTALQEETVPKILKILQSQNVEAVLLVPAWPLDHQSVGLIARKLEESGMPTIYLGSCRDMMELVKPPRAAFVNFPLGHQCGKLGEPELQTQILKDALSLFESAKSPGKIEDLEYTWDVPFTWQDYQKDISDMLEAEGLAAQNWKPNA